MRKSMCFTMLAMLMFFTSLSYSQSDPGQPVQPPKKEGKEFGVFKVYCEDLQKYVAAMSKAPQWKSEKDAQDMYAQTFDKILNEIFVKEMKLAPEVSKKIFAATSQVEFIVTAILPTEDNQERFARTKVGGAVVLKLNDFSMIKFDKPSEKYLDVDLFRSGNTYSAKTGDYLVFGSLSQVKKSLENIKNGKSACIIDSPGYKKAEEMGKAMPVWACFEFGNFIQFAPSFERSIFENISKSLQDVTGNTLFYSLDYKKGDICGKIETFSTQAVPKKNAAFFAPKKFTLAPNLPDKYIFMLTGHLQKSEEVWKVIKERIRESLREQMQNRGRGDGQDFFDEQLARFENELGLKIDADLVPACAGEFAIVLMEVPGRSFPYPLFVIKSANPVMAKEFLKKIRALVGQHRQIEEVDAGNGAKIVIVDRNDFNYLIDGDLIYISPNDKLLKEAFVAIKAGKTLDKIADQKKKMDEANSFFVSFNLDTINKGFAKMNLPAIMKENSFLTAMCNISEKSSVLNSDYDVLSLILSEIYFQLKNHERWQKQAEVDNIGNKLNTAVEQYSQKHNGPPEKIELLVKEGFVEQGQLKSPLDTRNVARSFGLVASKTDGIIYVYGYQPNLFETNKIFKVYGANYPNSFDEKGLKAQYDVVDPVPMPESDKKPAEK